MSDLETAVTGATPLRAAVPRSTSPIDQDMVKAQRVALRHALFTAHRLIGDHVWTELDDAILEGVTSWLGELEKRGSRKR